MTKAHLILVVASFTSAFGGAAAVAWLLAPPPAAGHAVVRQERLHSTGVDFGILCWRGTDRVEELVLDNRTSSTVMVERVEVGCGCIKVDVDVPFQIGAGASVAVPTRLQAARMVAAGGQRYGVIFHHADGGRTVVPVRYTFTPAVVAEPEVVLLTEREASAEVVLHVEPASGARATAAASADPRLDARLEDAAGTPTLVIRPTGGSASREPFEAEVTVDMVGSENGLVVPVVFEPPPALRAVPAAVVMPLDEAEASRTVTVRLDGLRSEDVEWEYDEALLDVRVATTEPDLIRVVVRPVHGAGGRSEAGSFTSVLVATSATSSDRLEIPVSTY